jgi:hypothetical protein
VAYLRLEHSPPHLSNKEPAFCCRLAHADANAISHVYGVGTTTLLKSWSSRERFGHNVIADQEAYSSTRGRSKLPIVVISVGMNQKLT